MLERRCGIPRPRSVITEPGCVPGGMVISLRPSRMASTVTVTPSAASTMGTETVQCRWSPSRTKTSCACSWTST
ncbi:Uncharacterised protein [Mycobacterium tuberculosis]|nr:Uncharacterised protein [Mycobacterium tuberculosis]CPA86241.1 Uncharacterised protein [Mycobacterium tuberculosis]